MHANILHISVFSNSCAMCSHSHYEVATDWATATSFSKHEQSDLCLQEARAALEVAEGEATAARERVKTLENDIQIVHAQQAALQSARQHASLHQVFILLLL